MKKISTAFLVLLFATNAYAQLDRAGNVIDDGGGSSGFSLNGVVFLVLGALAGLVFNLVRPELDAKFCVIAGAILGGVVQIFIGVLR